MQPISLLNNIVIYGQSPKFINAIKDIYPNAQIHMLPWRASELAAKALVSQINTPIDLLLICGYDYGSYSHPKKLYLNQNVYRIINICKMITNAGEKMVYIDTLDSKKHHTYSRYLYAKKLLGQQLKLSFPKAKILAIPTIFDKQHQIGMQGGLLSQVAAKLLIESGRIQTMNLEQLKAKLKSIIEFGNSNASTSSIQPILIGVPRPQFIDRALRILLG